ncbi:unnamed protein product [Symbiodinium sp. CCMP2456]|nr:unnamed protein product [Symbiodinium sp. CCMP2456]
MPADGLEECLGSPSPAVPWEEDGASTLPESTGNDAIERYVQFMIGMEATRPSMIRGIPVHRFLQQAPRKWSKSKVDSEQLYGLSEVVTRFDEFWSHSWRTKAWLKRLWLWCMFEMAAFMRSKGLGVEAENYLAVCPVFVGPTLLVGQLSFSVLMAATLTMSFDAVSYVLIAQVALALPCFLLLAYGVLAHCHSIDLVQSQVGSFTTEDSSCHCCSSGLCDIICDRMLIVRCIAAWFGSVENFETAVRGDVRRALVHQLANNVFSYWRIVHALCPLLWFSMDLMAPGMTLSHTISYALGGFTACLLVVPSIALVCLRLCYRLRKLFHGSRCYKLLLSGGMVAVGTLIWAIFFASQIILAQLLDSHFQSAIPRATAVLAVSSVVTVLLWRCCPSM